MCAAAGLLVRMHTGASALTPPRTQQQAEDEDCVRLAERMAALAFDFLARVTETGAGWRLLAPQFGALVRVRRDDPFLSSLSPQATVGPALMLT
jgi:hypothetical protein